MRAALLALLLSLPLATASLVPVLPSAVPDTPLASVAPPAPPAMPTLADLLADPNVGPVLRTTPGVRGLERLQASAQAEGSEPAPAPATDLGADGLQLAWLQAFLGVPTILRAVDLDGDGGTDLVAGTDTGLVAVDGKTWTVRWARPIGSPVVGLEVDAAAKPARIAVATGYGGRPSEALVVAANDGALAWRTAIPGGATGLALAGSDLLVATTTGATRLAAADGAVAWDAAPALLPATGAIVAALLNGGFYLSAFGDLTGDGVPDVAVARNAVAYATAVLTGAYSERLEVHAIDGATGAALWVHAMGGEGGTTAYTLATDLDLLDTRGDGTLDAAVAGVTIRYTSAVLASASSYEPFVRVLDGTGSAGLAVPLGSRGTLTPALPIELFTHLDHADAGAGAGDEVAVVRFSLADSLLGSPFNLERYAMPDEGSGAMVLVSDVAIPVGVVYDLVAPAGGAGARDLMAVGLDAVRVTAAGAEAGRREMDPSALTALDVGGATVLGTPEGLLVTSGDLQATTAEVPFHGSIRQAVRAGQGAGGFVAVAATDGALHVLDGVTGARLARHEVAGLGSIHASGNLLVLQHTNETTWLEGWFLPSGDVAWRTELEHPRTLVWFDGDGDGVDDVLAEYDSPAQTLRAVNGATGKTLWTSKLDTLSLTGSRVFAIPRMGVDDLGIEDFGDRHQLDGATGKLLWSDTDGFSSTCVGVAEAPDGLLAAAERDGDELVVRVYDRAGDAATIKPGLTANNCVLTPAPGGFLLAAAVWEDDAIHGHLSRHSGATNAWTLRFDGATVAVLLQDEASDRLYLQVGDQFLVRSLATGAALGGIGLGMPARQAVAHDLDGNGTMDLLLRTPDGLLRAAGRGLRLPDGATTPQGIVPDALADGVLGATDGGLPDGPQGDDRSAPGAGDAADPADAPAPDAIVAALALAVAVLLSRRKAGRLLRTD
ncbi:MAG: PQQ-like domain [Thermoplasmata archaeon]|jgi:outer membrane protein assembly factor BamB|nr:PQQ-like domain [Thermoplasmata archaeon]